MSYLGPSLRRVKRAERPIRRVLLAAAASLALNAALLWALVATGAFRVTGPPEQTRVALAPIPADRWAANRAVAPAPRAQPAPVQPPPEQRPAGRVVELPPDQKAAETPPAESKFLSDRNTRVDRETVSRHAGNYPRPAP